LPLAHAREIVRPVWRQAHMTESTAELRTGRVEFTGSRQELLGIILRGYLLMIPTVGLYRFWQATWKRRFYWQNTVIDGEPIEYTGTAGQLLLGFFFALAFFLPIYVALFVLSMQEVDYLLLGYIALGAIIWFLAGYAIYRARDFRLSRTLWRGIRFDLKGSALAYALRRFLWSLLMLPTLGLIYPWMGSSLWRYRWRNTWYGDRHFEIGGNWRVIAGAYYPAYFLSGLALLGTAGWITATGDLVAFEGIMIPGPIGLALCAGSVLVLAFSLAFYRTRVASRMLSTVSLGDARLKVTIGAGQLFGQFIIYILALVGLLILLALVALIAIGSIFAAAASGGGAADANAIAAMFASGTTNVALLILVYLIVLGAFGLLAELILGVGWWKLLARGALIENPDSLRSTKATGEDRALIGQGLADALNVGNY
jgi:uncharacterized membrane protein YjgN (DUF898 family)